MFKCILKLIFNICLGLIIGIIISIPLNRLEVLEQKINRDWAKDYLKYQHYYNNLERKI